MGSRAKAYAFPVVAAGLLAASLVGLGVQQNAAAQSAQRQDAQILSLKQRVTSVSRQHEDGKAAAAARAVGAPSGDAQADLARIQADRTAIQNVLETAFDWKDGASYDQARHTLQAQYGISADSAFLTEFLPPQPQSTDASGKSYSYIDAAGLNSQLGSFTAEPTSVAGTKYSYLVMASVQATSKDGRGTASRGDLIEVTLSPGGKLVSIAGWACPAQARSSGTDHTDVSAANG